MLIISNLKKYYCFIATLIYVLFTLLILINFTLLKLFYNYLKIKNMRQLFLFYLLNFATASFAQVGINTTNPKAQLEIKSSSETAPSNTDGLLIPKINAFPATNPTIDQQGMMVYLKNAVGIDQPGFYYWNFGTLEWIPVAGTSGGTLDQAYNFGGAGLGKTITADAGALLINGTDGLVATGTLNTGAIVPSGAGVRMVWNPRKGAFRSGSVITSQWDDVNVGLLSTAFGSSTIASGNSSTAFGTGTIASGIFSTSFGSNTIASGGGSVVFGSNNIASGVNSSSFGSQNTSKSIAETVFGIGATDYTISINGDGQFRSANDTDRLFVVGNAIDANNNNQVDTAERRDALIILKNGLTRLPSTTTAIITAADGKAVVTKEFLLSSGSNAWSITGNAATNAAVNFIGTLDEEDVVFKRNNIRAGFLAASNTSFGYFALNPISTGVNNTANGSYALFANTTGFSNTGTGFNALSSNTTGSRNTAHGHNSLDVNNVGNNNTANGFAALRNNSSGNDNTAVGHTALNVNTIGYGNTAIGRSSLLFNDVGHSNTAVGSTSLERNYADRNTGIGCAALRFNTTGTENTAIGDSALVNLTSGDNNTAIGYGASVANATGSNKVRIGNTAVTSARVQVAWTITSDNRWKSNIMKSNLGLDFIKQLNPVFYTRKDIQDNGGKTNILETTTNPTTEYGFIAQELEATLNKFDTSNNGIISKDDAGMYGVRYNDLMAPMVKAIQEQQAIIETQKQQLEAQSMTILQIIKRLEILENKN